LVLIADGHFQLHRVVLLHDGAGSADAGMQKALQPLIPISRKIESAVVRRNRQRDTAGEAGRAAVLVRRGGGCRSVQHETCGVDYFAGDSDGIGRSGLARTCGTNSLGKRTTARMEDSVNQPSLRKPETIPPELCYVSFLPFFIVVRL